MARRKAAQRKSRSKGAGDPFVSTSNNRSEDETNLGSLLKRALAGETQDSSRNTGPTRESDQDAQHCADCWNAVTFTDDRGGPSARCEKSLWVKPVYTHEELNQDKVRRWHAVCPEYDDSD